MARFKDERDYLKTHTQDPFDAMARQSEKELDSGTWGAEELLTGIDRDPTGDDAPRGKTKGIVSGFGDNVGGSTRPKKNDCGV